MKQGIFEIVENREYAPILHRLTLRGDTSAITAPGQFVNVQIDGLFLRRPFSVCDVEGDRLTVILKTVGEGTARLAAMGPGARLDLLTGLGNGFDLEKSGDRPALLGGGSGVPPLYMSCKRLLAAGKKPTVVLGFSAGYEAFYLEEFAALGAGVIVLTADGSLGRQGLVTDGLDGLDYSFIYACGPIPMLAAIAEKARTGAQFSMESRMGCGFGACMGCTVETVHGPRRVCKDGPVFDKEEIVWQTLL